MSSMNPPFFGRPAFRRPRAAGILGAAMILVAATYVAGALRVHPVTPSTADAPGNAGRIDASAGVAGNLATLSLDQIDRSIDAWAANLKAEPRDFYAATNLATLYHGRGQLTSNLDDHQLALDAARDALATEPTYAPARALQATIQYTLHEFDAALATADSLFREDPSQLGALATRADAELELGRIDAARSDFDRLAALASGPALEIRLARFAFVIGQAATARRHAETARAEAEATAAATGSIDAGFYEFAAGEYARLTGDADAARADYQAALAIRATDVGALVGLARIDAFDGRTKEAIAGLEAAAAIAPQPETLAILGDLRSASGDQSAASKAYDTVRFIGRLGTLQGTVYDRQLLRFELDHEGVTIAVLAAARASLDARPDATGHDLVAWALFRLGRYDEAAAEIQAARASGADDARLKFHDGAIALARHQVTAGRSLLESALASGPALDPIERAEALRLMGA
jgi:lipopolysaccharide biosynthesis regulator YciM